MGAGHTEESLIAQAAQETLSSRVHLDVRLCENSHGMVQEARLGGLSAGGTIRLSAPGNAYDPFVLRLLWALFNTLHRRQLTSLALILGIEPKVYRPAFPCWDSSRSPWATATLFLSVCARFRFARPPSSQGGAVDGGRAGSSGSSGNNRKKELGCGGACRACSGLGR
jgi:hypothetical protein